MKDPSVRRTNFFFSRRAWSTPSYSLGSTPSSSSSNCSRSPPGLMRNLPRGRERRGRIRRSASEQ